MPRLGCINIHASLLPRWRGAAPIQRAIEAGDAETGVTIMQMDAGLDTGAILLLEATPIGADEHQRARLLPRLAALGGDLGGARRWPMPPAGRLQAGRSPRSASPTPPRSRKAEATIDWRAAGGDDRAAAARLRSVSGRAQRRRRGETITCWRRRGSPVAGGGAEPGEIVAVDGWRDHRRLRRGRACPHSNCSVPAAGG